MKYRIGDLCEVNKNSFKKNELPEEFTYLDTSSITKGIFSNPSKLIVGKDDIPSRARRKVMQNDILYSTVRPVNRHYGFIDDPINVVASTGFAVLTPNASKVDPYYLYIFLTLTPIVEKLQVIAENSTSAYPSIKPSDITNLEIDLPSLYVQKNISTFFKNINNKITINNKIIANLEELAQTLFKRWFIDFNFPNTEGEPYYSSGGEMVESELGLLPVGWEAVKVKDIAQIVGKNVKVSEINNNTSYIGLEHMPQASIALSSWQTSEKVNSNKTAYNKKNILFGKLRPYFKKVGIAPNNGVCSTDILVVNSIKREHYSFLVCLLAQDKFIEYCNATSTGTRMPRTSWKAMGEYKVTLPPSNLSNDFNEIIAPYFDKILDLIYENKNLENVRDALIPKLLSGEKEIDEESEVETNAALP